MASIIVMGKMDNGKSAHQDLLKTAKFESLDPNLVKVLDNGKLIAVKTGTAKVKVTIGNLSKIIIVNVQEESVADLLFLTLSQDVVSLKKGEQFKFTYETGVVTMSEVKTLGVNKKVNVSGTLTDGTAATSSMLQDNATFESNKTSVATVDANGVVTAVNEGDAQIKVTVEGVETILSLHVEAATLETLSLDQSNLTVVTGDTVTFQFS